MYRSIQLVLVERDGDNKNIVLAVAMCASESGENCEWVFRCCIRAGVKLHETPLFSDRGSGILAALKTLSVGTLCYCTRHILNNIRGEFKGQWPLDIKNVLYRVQGAQSGEEYDSISKTIELEHWVLYTALRSRRLYGWRSTNFAESRNAAAIDSSRMLPFQCLESIMKKFMTSACCNRETIVPAWVGAGHKITSYANKNLPRRTVVHMLVYDQYGIPCKHYIAALNYRNRGIEKYACVDACYTIEAYTNLYGSGQQRIQLVLPEELIVNGDHRSPKLAEKKKDKKGDRRFPSKGDTTLQVGKSKRTMKCSNCGQPGHNKRRCTSK
ncbi:hypothetical protein PHMEG_0009994 [Phytophthora megakarya]|uniref:CCHC-type domain-containing protein n=1 Tax=Phytophthora megakarya TaxID=4795 RepID=A0A225WET8_9STRA|nr:hypothetical protein PHMEG_0009994 [Phytophthora megakarya]